MTIALVQSVTGTGATITLNNVVAGNALTLQSSPYRGSSSGIAEAIPTDSNGTFLRLRADAPSIAGGHDTMASVFYALAVAAGTHTVTPEANQSIHVTLAEWSGLTAVESAGVAAQNGSGTGTSQTTGTTGVTSQPEELALVQFAMGAFTTGSSACGLADPPTNYTRLNIGQNDLSDLCFGHYYRILSATGTQELTLTWTNTESDQWWQASIGLLKGAATVTDPLPIEDASLQPVEPEEWSDVQGFIHEPIQPNAPAQVDQFISYFPDQAEEPEEEWILVDTSIGPAPTLAADLIFVEDGSLQPVEPEEQADLQGFELAPLSANAPAVTDMIFAEDASMQPVEQEEDTLGFFDAPLTVPSAVVSTSVHSKRKGVSRTHVIGA